MGISEVNSKGGCLRLAVKHLKQLQDNTMEVLAWLERSEAFVPDESKVVQELKAALLESLQRETELENALTLSEDSRDGLKKNLAKSIELEKELERRLLASFARELRLTSYIGGLAKMAAEAESILDEMRSISRAPIAVGGDPLPILHHPSPHLDQEKFKHTGIFPVAEEDKARQGLNNPVEACCQNYEECNKQCVPLANYWRNRAKEAEKKVKAYQWHMQWTIPDVTCNTEPVKPRPLL